ncbi:MAG: hypothetical protein LIP01_16075 [Tannerellaceae bacterium]|nr:hypothetical protein [Tannerellaceae bacterium]
MKATKYILLSFIFLPVLLKSQNNLTSSPYSMYGVGEIISGLYGQNSAMGGVAYGMNNPGLINVDNPAGLTGMDFMKIYAETSVFLKNSWYSSGGDSHKALTGNLSSFLLGTRLAKRWYAAAGLAPYTGVGYYFKSTEPLEGTTNSYITSTYQGDGGLSKFFLSNGVRLPANFSLGMNFNYYMGTISTSETQSGAALSETFQASFFHVDFGLQYSRRLGKQTHLSVGAVYGYKQEYKLKASRTVSGTLISNEYDVKNITQYLPEFYGVGGMLEYKKMVYAADYTFRKYSVVSSGVSRIRYQDVHELRTGVCYNPGGRSFEGYWSKVAYKAGLNFSTPYYTINGKSGLNWRASAGMALPMFNGVLNTAFFYENQEIYGKFKQQAAGVTVSFTLNESMFRVKL